jgi:hypothetical protein
MRSEVNLRRLGLENSGSLRVGHIPQNTEDERSATLVAHWKCKLRIAALRMEFHSPT